MPAVEVISFRFVRPAVGDVLSTGLALDRVSVGWYVPTPWTILGEGWVPARLPVPPRAFPSPEAAWRFLPAGGDV